MIFMQHPKNKQSMDDTFTAALNAAFEPKDAMDEVLNTLSGMGDEEIAEMRQTASAAQKALQALAKTKTPK